MSSYSVSYEGSINNTTTAFSDRMALSLPDLTKDIITAFHAMTQFSSRALQRTTNSYSARFPASSTMSAAYHTPGTRLLGMTPPAKNFRDIVLDDRLVTHLFVDELDANVRTIVPFQSMFAQEMGQAIAQFDDINTAIIAILAARAAATVSGGQGGQTLTKASCDTNVGALNAVIWDAKNAMDEINAPSTGRSLGLRPAQFNLLTASLDRMFYRELGQTGGSIGANVVIPGYAGFEEIFMSNNIPKTNITSNPSGAQNTYTGDFRNTVAIAFAKRAFGTVTSASSLPQGGNTQPTPTGADTATTMHPVQVRSVEIPEAYGTLYLASLITGHGVLNPASALEILKS